jgi:hypothetical protein
MAPPPSSDTLEFGPQRAPIWIGRISGLMACLASVSLLAVAGETVGQAAGMAAACTVFALAVAVFGVWMLVTAARISSFRATLTPEALRLAATGGRGIWLQGAVTEHTIAWAEVQGFSRVDVMNPAEQGGAQATYILYTKRGDFNLNNVQWQNLEGLMREMARRSGHAAGEVAPERTAAQTELHRSEHRMRSVLRVFGSIILAMSGAMLLLVLPGLSTGFSSDLAKAGFVLVFAVSAAVSMIRFYRRP